MVLCGTKKLRDGLQVSGSRHCKTGEGSKYNINEEVEGLTVVKWVTAGAPTGQSRSTSSYTLCCTSGYKANSAITKLSE